MLTAQMILAARSPFFVELMMKNPQHCVITNIDMETLRLLVRTPGFRPFGSKTFCQFCVSGQVHVHQPCRRLQYLSCSDYQAPRCCGNVSGSLASMCLMASNVIKSCKCRQGGDGERGTGRSAHGGNRNRDRGKLIEFILNRNLL